MEEKRANILVSGEAALLLTQFATMGTKTARDAMVVATALVAFPTVALACDCESLAADQRTVERIQSSWMSGSVSTRAGDYAKALRELRSTAVLIPSIHDGKARECVAAGANNLIASAAAGEAYLSGHPRDVAGAKGAAQRAWRVFVNCP